MKRLNNDQRATQAVTLLFLAGALLFVVVSSGVSLFQAFARLA
jgi:hypothetical protein